MENSVALKIIAACLLASSFSKLWFNQAGDYITKIITKTPPKKKKNQFSILDKSVIT